MVEFAFTTTKMITITIIAFVLNGFNVNAQNVAGYDNGCNNTSTGCNGELGSLPAAGAGNDNTALGGGALNAVTTQSGNTAVGKDAGAGNTGDRCSFFGYNAGATNTYAENTFLGYLSGSINTTGGELVFVGANTGLNNNGWYNTFVGRNAGQSNTYAGHNTFIGTNSGNANIGGGYNTFTGVNSGFVNNYGQFNTFNGVSSGFSNTTGNYNSFFGNQSGYKTTVAEFNTFIGNASGYSNIVGDQNTFTGDHSGYNNLADNNTFTGYNSGYSNTTGTRNTYLGTQTGVLSDVYTDNTFTGFFSGHNNKAYGNTFTGSYSGTANTTGDQNVFNGYSAGAINTSGKYNTFVGFNAGLNNNADRNTFLGTNAGNSTTTGSANTFAGVNSGFKNINGYDNTFNGRDAGFNNTSGFNNVYIGLQAGDNNTVGDDNTYVGYKAKGSANNFRNSAVFGSNAIVRGDKKMILGDNDIMVGIGLSNDLALNGPQNKLEINYSVLGTFATPNNDPNLQGQGFSGLRFRDLTASSMTYKYNPGKGVLSVDGNGDVIYVPNSLPSANNGCSVIGGVVQLGGDCGSAAPAVLINDREIPMDSHITRFTGDGEVQIIGLPPATCTGSSAMLYVRNNAGTRPVSLRVENNTGPVAADFLGDVSVNGNLFQNGFNFTLSGGAWITSDSVFKTNVDSITGALNIIKQLKPRKYFMDTTNAHNLKFSSKQQYGLIAQQVETVLPELVSSVTKPTEYDSTGAITFSSYTYKAVNYNALFGILLRGIQEQQRTIDSLKTKNAYQDSINKYVQNQISVLTAIIDSCCSLKQAIRYNNNNNKSENIGNGNKNNSTSFTDVKLTDGQSIVLEQNVPNPFAEQTTINYYLPDNTGKAQMLFYNSGGKLIQSIELTQKGKGQLNVFAQDLTNGMYTYTLVVDGRIFETKKMVKQ